MLAGQVGDEYTVMGDPVNVAARLQAAARPGSVTVGATTHRADPRRDRVRRAGAARAQGQVRAGARRGRPSRCSSAARRARGARVETPLIGREDEWSLLESHYERVVSEGRPHLVTVLGQAGVGKSRLLRELVAKLGDHDQQPALREGRCPAYGAAISYWALGEIMREQFEILDTDDSDVAVGKLHRGIEELVSDDETDEAPERHRGADRAPAGDRGAGRRRAPRPARDRGPAADARPHVLRRALARRGRAAARRPLVLAIEDIHWADEGMLDLIEYLARWVRGPVLIVCLARDELLERRPGWGGGRRNAT